MLYFPPLLPKPFGPRNACPKRMARPLHQILSLPRRRVGCGFGQSYQHETQEGEEMKYALEGLEGAKCLRSLASEGFVVQDPYDQSCAR